MLKGEFSLPLILHLVPVGHNTFSSGIHRFVCHRG